MSADRIFEKTQLSAHLQERAAYFASLAKEPKPLANKAPSGKIQIGNFLHRLADLVDNYEPTGAISFKVTRKR